MLHTTLARISTAAAVLICGFAIVRGRTPERVGGIAVLVAWFASSLVQVHHGRRAPLFGVFAVDLTLLIVMVALVLVTTRRWVICLCAFQLLIVLTHIAPMIDQRIGRWAYISAYYVWSILGIAALGVGVLLEAKDDWRRAGSGALVG